jgi:isoquinoline 1-oxidoreductase beta subunit
MPLEPASPALDDPPRGISRRSLLRAGVAVGGGLLLGISLAHGHAANANPGDDALGTRFDAFLRIAPDDTVTMIMPAVEMGQGAYTSTTMMVAEELDIGLEHFRLEAAPPDAKHYGNPIYVEQMTGGSTTTMGWYLPLRKVGASARHMLVGAAAVAWGVDAATLRTENGTIYHDASGRSARYGALAARAAAIAPPLDPTLKATKNFTLIGKPTHRLDTPDKVDGKAEYGIDVMLPGMRFATLASSPVFGGKVRHVDDTQARMVAGVRQIVVLDDLVAVIGDHMWAAKQGLDALVVEWDDGANAAVTQAGLWQSMERGSLGAGVTAKTAGDAIGALKGDGVYETVFELPFLSHAAMEPMNCTVHVRADACDVWVGTQVPMKALNAAAKAAGLAPEQVTIRNHLIGGGFGRRLEPDGIEKAVRIGTKVAGPVKVVWTREEDIQQEMYRPIYHMRTRATVADGRIAAWHHRITGPALIARRLPAIFTKGLDVDAVEGAVDEPYDIPNLLVEYVRHEIPEVPTTFWRGVGPNANVFATECMVDKMARDLNVDPVAFRRPMLAKNPRGLAALDLAAEKANWAAPLPSRDGFRVGRGIALLSAFGSYLACVAEVAIGDDGDVRVTRVVCAADVGAIVNPDGLRAQVEGGTIFGISAVLHGLVTIEKGRVQQSNFHDYRVLRIDEAPVIECHFIHNDEKPGGIGEPGTVGVQVAVANAVFAATGVQLTRMPIDRSLISKAATA